MRCFHIDPGGSHTRPPFAQAAAGLFSASGELLPGFHGTLSNDGIKRMFDGRNVTAGHYLVRLSANQPGKMVVQYAEPNGPGLLVRKVLVHVKPLHRAFSFLPDPKGPADVAGTMQALLAGKPAFATPLPRQVPPALAVVFPAPAPAPQRTLQSTYMDASAISAAASSQPATPWQGASQRPAPLRTPQDKFAEPAPTPASAALSPLRPPDHAVVTQVFGIAANGAPVFAVCPAQPPAPAQPAGNTVQSSYADARGLAMMAGGQWAPPAAAHTQPAPAAPQWAGPSAAPAPAQWAPPGQGSNAVPTFPFQGPMDPGTPPATLDPAYGSLPAVVGAAPAAPQWAPPQAAMPQPATGAQWAPPASTGQPAAMPTEYTSFGALNPAAPGTTVASAYGTLAGGPAWAGPGASVQRMGSSDPA